MLPTVSIHPSDPTDIGALAEAAVFFPKTRWVVSARMAAALAKSFGWEKLHRFLNVSGVTLVLERSMVSSQREDNTIAVGIMTLQRGENSQYDDAEEELEHRLFQTFEITKATRAEIERLVPRIDSKSAEFGGAEVAAGDMLDNSLTTKIARSLAGNDAPGTFFHFERAERRLLGTNWSFQTDFEVRAPHLPLAAHQIDPESMARAIYSTTREVVRNADGRTDLWLPADMSSTLRCKVESLAESAVQGRREIDIFSEVVFQRRAIASAIRSGEKSLDDVLSFLEHPNTQQWRGWIANQTPEASLLENYYRSVYEPSSHFDSQPLKTGRLVTMVGAAITSASLTQGLGLAASITAGVAEAIGGDAVAKLSSKAFEPWRPNQWVATAVDEFLPGH